MSDPLTSLGAARLAAAVRSGELTATTVVQAFLDRIEATDARVGAFLEVYREASLAAATEVDAARERGETLGPLAGVPVALKDAFTHRGQLSTCGSRILEGFRAPYSATVVERLEAAGAIIIGRTNMDEFAMGSSTEHSAFGVTRNPFDLERVPGGSSGGSAAAVAARMAPIALGSDTGGSVRQPASLCGVAGIKPTYGRVSRYGLIAFASSLDHVAPFTHNAEDAALVMTVLAGVDDRDATSLAAPVPDYAAATSRAIEGMRIGVPDEYFAGTIDDEVAAAVELALVALEQLGATRHRVSLPHSRFAIPAYYLVANAEASSNLARYDGVAHGLRVSGHESLDRMYEDTRTEGFGDEAKLRILLGTFCLRSGYYDDYYLKATKVRTLIRRDFESAFAACDVLVGPTSPFPAFRLGEKLDDPLQMYACDVLTTPANLAGIPAMSVPCGHTTTGLPIGLQVLGPVLGEERVLQVAAAFQRATAHHTREPVL